MRTYRYVGPPDIRSKAATQPPGRVIRDKSDVLAWITETAQTLHADDILPATFVIDVAGHLRLADRHSEHVACAAGGDVLTAGEIFFALAGPGVRVAEISNQSTGYCPEPTSWPAVDAALNRIGLTHPHGFTTECIFRRCDACGARNIVKGAWSLRGLR